jgi:excisionase family DNA binding protein
MRAGCKTLSVPEAGRLYLGLSRNGAYDAAKRGEIPVIKVGRRYRVPIVAMERLLDSVIPKPAEMTP